MKQKGKRTLTPKLRFPEFRDEPVWEEKNLSEITSAIFDGTHQTPTYTEAGIPFYSVENLISGNANKFISKEDHDLATRNNKPEKGDILLTRIGKIGFSQVVTWEHEFSVYVTLAVIKRSSQFNSHYLHCLMQSYFYQSELGSKSLSNAVPPKINMDSLRETKVLLPIPAEQQKIAECLTSLDELIAAEGRKLAALRDHKRGLMQQLFPQPGQTQPRLRFPEFRGKGEWEGHTIGDIVNISKGKGVAKADIVEGGATPCIRYAELYTTYGEVITQVRSQTNVPVDDLILSEAGDVIIPASGETKEDIATCACVIDAGVALGSDLNVLRSGFDGRFFSYYLNGAKRSELAKVAQGDTVAHLYPSQISQLNIALPSNEGEQQRIAACLTTLDTLIKAQTAKIEALKQHKRGLMQQLFPAPELS